MTEIIDTSVSLSDAPKSLQIAVDLIQLLEENQIETPIAIAALEIVLNDFKNKADASIK